MDFRGGVIEDLHLPPLAAVNSQWTIEEALELALEGSPEVPEITAVYNTCKKEIIGYITKESLTSCKETDSVSDHTIRNGVSSLNISDPIEMLVASFDSGVKVAEIWDASKRHILAVATKQDLERRFPHISK